MKRIKAKTIAIGIPTDILFPLSEQEFIAENIEGAQFETIDSLYGHDGFLLEFEQLHQIIIDNLQLSIRGK